MSLMTLALADVPAADAGVASGIINVSVQIAAAFGMAILGTVASARTSTLEASGSSLTDALAGGYQVAFVIAAASVAAGLVAALRWLRPARTEAMPAPVGVRLAVERLAALAAPAPRLRRRRSHGGGASRVAGQPQRGTSRSPHARTRGARTDPSAGAP